MSAQRHVNCVSDIVWDCVERHMQTSMIIYGDL